MSVKHMALSMSIDRDERKFRMANEIRTGETRTVRSCERSLMLSRGTILTYLKELNMSIYDTEKKEMTKVYNDETEVIHPF